MSESIESLQDCKVATGPDVASVMWQQAETLGMRTRRAQIEHVDPLDLCATARGTAGSRDAFQVVTVVLERDVRRDGVVGHRGIPAFFDQRADSLRFGVDCRRSGPIRAERSSCMRSRQNLRKSSLVSTGAPKRIQLHMPACSCHRCGMHLTSASATSIRTAALTTL